ncbi:hypothetical protein CL616_01410 [archaeon]|nr:hypothetical protein [archaeon]
MVKQFLITRPRYDKHTGYLYSFSKAIIRIIKENKKIHLNELKGSKANRKNVISSLSKQKPTLVFFNGHGNEWTVFGHNDKPILDEENINLTKGKIIYALACDSLTELGEVAVNKGAKAYIGYKDEFMWVGDPSKSSAPDKDKNAIPFRRACHVLIYSLVTGIPVKKAIQKTKGEYRKLIKTYGNSKDDPYGDTPAIGLALSWDMLALDMVGDPKAAF